MLDKGGDVLELLGAVVARVVEVLHGQLAHQHVILEAGHASRREITTRIGTSAKILLSYFQGCGSGPFFLIFE